MIKKWCSVNVNNIKARFILTATTATEERVTLDLMEVFTWRPAAVATATHRVQCNPLFSVLILPVHVTHYRAGFRCPGY